MKAGGNGGGWRKVISNIKTAKANENENGGVKISAGSVSMSWHLFNRNIMQQAASK
jgi:hypothetical protein